MGNEQAMMRVRFSVEKLKRSRADVAKWERELQQAVAALAQAHEGGQQEWAREIGVSASYAAAILSGRRKISENLLRRLLERRQSA